MSLEVLVYVLTALAAVAVLLTRARLRNDAGAGRHHVGMGLANLHFVVGLLALVIWVVFLVAPEDSVAGGSLVGIIALGLWWVTVFAGLLLLVRWLPARGRHATRARTDGWSNGPVLSVLAHAGLLGAVLVFSYAYLTSVV